MGPIAEWAAALEGSPLGAAMRGGWYPPANVAHVLGVVLLAAGLGAVDLRIIGLGRTIPIAALSRMMTPVAVVGLIVLAASGSMLFAADAGPHLRRDVFLWKMGLLAVALGNAAAFRWRFGDFAGGREPSVAAKAMAGASVALWLAVICLGRLIAYR